jgi:hypothetical protein
MTQKSHKINSGDFKSEIRLETIKEILQYLKL